MSWVCKPWRSFQTASGCVCTNGMISWVHTVTPHLASCHICAHLVLALGVWDGACKFQDCRFDRYRQAKTHFGPATVQSSGLCANICYTIWRAYGCTLGISLYRTLYISHLMCIAPVTNRKSYHIQYLSKTGFVWSAPSTLAHINTTVYWMLLSITLKWYDACAGPEPWCNTAPSDACGNNCKEC